MNLCKIYTFFAILLVIQFISVKSHRNWLKWFKSFKLVKMEMLSGRALGIHRDPPSSFDILTDGLKYNVDPSLLLDRVNHGTSAADLIYGKGLIVKGNLINPITVPVSLPTLPKQSNVCGLVITSLDDNNCDFIFNLRLYWKSESSAKWDMISNPTSGDFEYNLRMRRNSNTRVVIFDTVPALHLLLMLTTIPRKCVNFKLALLQSCHYRNTIQIANCGEKIDLNPRFASLPFEVPISIKCPIDCIRSWPCWGFKVYSTDSPICWAATQNFGRWGNGYYTLYKIPGVITFRMELNPSINHGIFCRRSILSYQGFTFDRKYLDFSRNEYRDAMGA